MWTVKFEERLADWANLRESAQQADIEQQLSQINDWWFRAPISNHYLHLDDISKWPSPWDLLSDNIYCEVARAAGIVYTVLMMENNTINTCEIIDTDKGVFVSINNGEYILNYAPKTLLNNQQGLFNITRIIDLTALQKNIS